MSTFDQRSDAAGRALKQELSARNGVEIPFSPVAVGPDGKPPPPLPPEGSYARQFHDQQLRAEQAEAAQRAQADLAAGQPSRQQIIGDQPPYGTPDQQADGSVAPPLARGRQQPAEAQPQASQLSEGANARIQQLVAEIREKDRKIAELAGSRGELEKLQMQVTGLLAERDSFLQKHLDDLEPEQRAAILAEARTRELLAENNRALLGEIMPHLSTLQQAKQQSEMERVATKYPGFDMQIHPHLVDQIRAKNPHLTYEMAFKAVAEGDEAVPREQSSAVAVPPMVAAGHGPALPRYMPEPRPNPQDALVEFQARTNKMLASTNPAERRQGMRQLDEVLKARLAGASYDKKPSVFS